MDTLNDHFILSLIFQEEDTSVLDTIASLTRIQNLDGNSAVITVSLTC